MSLLENEVAKLEKKGYKGSRKSLKYGKAVILKKKKSGISGFAGYNNVVYLYSAYKEPDAQAISEFLYSFKKFVSDEGLDINDVRGNFLVKGAFDKATFNTLQKALIKKDSIRNAITVKQLETVMEKEKTGYHEERIKEKIVEREITRRSVTTEKVSLTKVVNAIESVSFIKAKKEHEYQSMLYTYLDGRGFEVQHEKSRGGARFDLVIGDDEIAIELKVIRSSSQFHTLFSQVSKYKKQFQKVIVVLIDVLKNPSIMKQEVRRIEEIDPEKIVVVIR